MQASWLVGSVLLLWTGSLWAGGRDLDASNAPAAQTSAAHAAEAGLDTNMWALHHPDGVVFDGTLTDLIAFFTPHKSGNGRSCATCHRPEDHFGLTPATVEARYQALKARRQYDPDADDPLFRDLRKNISGND